MRTRLKTLIICLIAAVWFSSIPVYAGTDAASDAEDYPVLEDAVSGFAVLADVAVDYPVIEDAYVRKSRGTSNFSYENITAARGAQYEGQGHTVINSKYYGTDEIIAAMKIELPAKEEMEDLELSRFDFVFSIFKNPNYTLGNQSYIFHYSTNTDWSETALTWNNKPSFMDRTDTKFTVTGLSAGSMYTFKVEAGNEHGKWTEDGPSITITTERESNPGNPDTPVVAPSPEPTEEPGEPNRIDIAEPEAGADGIAKASIGTEAYNVWHIDEEGAATAVASGKYDAEQGGVVFQAGQTGRYAIQYVHKTFNDLGRHDWAKQSIEAMASRGIIQGTTAETFNPGAAIKRADFIALLVRTLGLRSAAEENFDDVAAGTIDLQTRDDDTHRSRAGTTWEVAGDGNDKRSGKLWRP